MSDITTQTARVNELLAKWKAHRAGIPEPDRYCQLKADLYQVRNAGWKSNPPLSSWPADLVDADDGIMAAVEHYFLCRCWIGTAEFPSWELRTLNMVYDMGKLAGVTPRHNPTKPTTPLTAVQMASKEAGIRDGEIDLAKSGKSAPWIKAPPKY
ncbi:MAG: hypothetical protein ABI624_22680 [Casimicrobiaceae bacterium]